MHRTYVNLFVTMLLGGLWHGAAWTFVFWGALHGAYLAIERPFRKRLKAAAESFFLVRLGWTIGTLLLVTLAWVPFRARSFSDCIGLLKALAGEPTGSLSIHWFDQFMVLALAGSTFLAHGLMHRHRLEHIGAKLPMPVVAVVTAFMLLMIIMSPVSDHAFIYFQF